MFKLYALFEKRLEKGSEYLSLIWYVVKLEGEYTESTSLFIESVLFWLNKYELSTKNDIKKNIQKYVACLKVKLFFH